MATSSTAGSPSTNLNQGPVVSLTICKSSSAFHCCIHLRLGPQMSSSGANTPKKWVGCYSSILSNLLRKGIFWTEIKFCSFWKCNQKWLIWLSLTEIFRLCFNTAMPNFEDEQKKFSLVQIFGYLAPRGQPCRNRILCLLSSSNPVW